jgi:hypothetical protein
MDSTWLTMTSIQLAKRNTKKQAKTVLNNYLALPIQITRTITVARVCATLLVVEAAVVPASHMVVPMVAGNMAMAQVPMSHVISIGVGFILHITGTKPRER